MRFRAVCLSACLFARLPACVSVCLLACLSVCLSACLPVCLPACLRACVPACVPVCLSVSHSLFDIPESSLFASDMLPAINFNPYLFLIYFISYLVINLFVSFFLCLLGSIGRPCTSLVCPSVAAKYQELSHTDFTHSNTFKIIVSYLIMLRRPLSSK